MGKQQTKRHEPPGRVTMLVTKAELGARGAGMAWRVHDPSIDRDIVRVTIDGAAVANSKARKYVKRHLEAAKGLSHPSIVPLLDGGTDDGEGRGWLLDDQHPDERPLRARLAEGPLPPRDALQVGLDVLNGLAYAHARGLVHGGLSPDGVLVRPTPEGLRGRLVDYGFARVVAPEVEGPLGPVRADADYAAPEMIKSEFADGRADVYAAALIIQEMLTGQHPIPAPGRTRILHRLNESAPPLPAGLIHDGPLDEAVRAALRTALMKNPAARFPSARAFAEALRPGAPAPSEPHPVVAQSGGECAATKAPIKPANERVWTRHESDAPFVCPVARELFAGKDSWDARALCSKKAVDAPFVLGPPPTRPDVTLDLSAALARKASVRAATQPSAPPAPAPAPGAATPAGPGTRPLDDEASRREALKTLLEGERRGTGRTGPIPVPAPTPAAPSQAAPTRVGTPAAAATPDGPGKPAAPAPSAGRTDASTAILSAWSAEKERAKAAAARVDSTRDPARVVPDLTAPDRLPPPPPKAPDPTGWKVALAAAVLICGYVIVLWRDDKAKHKLDLAALQERLEGQLRPMNANLEHKIEANDAQTRKVAELNATLAAVQSAERGLRARVEALDGRLAEATKAHAAVEAERQALDGRLAEATRLADGLAAERTTLEAGLSEKAAALARLADERAALAKRLGLEPSSADRDAIERRLGENQATRERLQAEQAALSARVDEAARALAASQREQEAARKELLAARSRLDDAELERRDLELQLVAASRGTAELTTEKRELEASLADAQEALQASEQLVAALMNGEDEPPVEPAAATLPLQVSPPRPDAPEDELTFVVPGESLRAVLVDAAASRVVLAVVLAPGDPALKAALELPDGTRVVLPVAQAKDGARLFVDAALAAQALELLDDPEEVLVLAVSPKGDPARVEASIVATPLPEDAQLRAGAR